MQILSLIPLLFFPVFFIAFAFAGEDMCGGKKVLPKNRKKPTHYLDKTIGQYRRIDNNKIESLK